MAYKHEGFWQPMDTLREKTMLEDLWQSGKAPWKVTNKAKITVLQRLVDAYAAGTPHVNSKLLMDGTGCKSPSNLFTGKSSPWRDYIVRVEGARAWELKMPGMEMVIDDDGHRRRPTCEEFLELIAAGSLERLPMPPSNTIASAAVTCFG